MYSSKRVASPRSPRLARCTELVLGIGILVSISEVTAAKAATSEIDSYQMAVTSQRKEAALAFIDEFESSHLVGDLIDSLSPEVAREVCGSLSNGPSSAQAACARLKLPVVMQPATANRLQPIVSSASSVDPSRQSQTSDLAVESGISDSSISPAAGSDLTPDESTDTTPHTGGKGARNEANALLVMPDEDDSVDHAATDKNGRKVASSKEPEEAPKPHHDPAPPAPSAGSDPGSDPGSASSPSSHGKDPGSDGGSGSGGGSDHDSHN